MSRRTPQHAITTPLSESLCMLLDAGAPSAAATGGESEPAERAASGAADTSVVSDSAHRTSQATEPSALDLVELLLKQPSQVERLVRSPSEQPLLAPRFLAIALVGFTIFGVAATMALNSSMIWPAYVPASRWYDSSVLNLSLAYTLGFVAAIGVCLPSFYFYTLLAGIRLSMLAVTTHALKSLAAGAVALVGILPIALAVALGAAVFDFPPKAVVIVQYGLLLLPFISGLYAVRSLRAGFRAEAQRSLLCQEDSRACFLNRLILAWSGCYTAVTPLMVYSLWNYFARIGT